MRYIKIKISHARPHGSITNYSQQLKVDKGSKSVIFNGFHFVLLQEPVLTEKNYNRIVKISDNAQLSKFLQWREYISGQDV